MKTLFLTILSLIAAVPTLSARERIDERIFDNIGNFEQIKVKAPYEVYISQTGKCGIRVECNSELTKCLDITVKEGTLYIDMEGISDSDLEKYINRRNYTLTAYVTIDELEKISAAGISEVHADGCIVTDDLDLNISGVSKIIGEFRGDILDVDVSGTSSFSGELKFYHVKTDVSGASKCELEGKTDDIVARVSGASALYAEYLECGDADVTVSGASTCEVRPEDTISFSVSGVSTLRYSWDAKIESMSVSGMSKAKTF